MTDSTKTFQVAKTEADVVIFEGNYPTWPWVTRDDNGKLYCVFREDGLKDRKDTGHGYSPLGHVRITTSDDSGKTWTPSWVVVDNPGKDDLGVSLAVMSDQSLLVSYWSRFSAGGYSQPWVTRSTDDGQTWQESIPISDQDTRSRGEPVEMSNGQIFVPIYRSMYHKDGLQSIAAVSGDGGRTWQNHLVPNASAKESNEWSALEVEPGRIIGLLRDECPATRGLLWKTESHDFGRTWMIPIATNVRDSTSTASPPQLGFHGDRVVLTYSDARQVSVSMVTTDDPEFVQWNVDERVPCFQYRADGKKIADASYPCSVAVGPQRRLIVDYEIESLITPSPDHVIDYELTVERKQITGHFVDTPVDWGTAD